MYLISWRHIFPSKYSVRDSKSILHLLGRYFVSRTQNRYLSVRLLFPLSFGGSRKQSAHPGSCDYRAAPAQWAWPDLHHTRSSQWPCGLNCGFTETRITSSHLSRGGVWTPDSKKFCKNMKVCTGLPLLQALLATSSCRGRRAVLLTGDVQLKRF